MVYLFHLFLYKKKKTTVNVQNTTLTYKKPLKTTDKKYHKLVFCQ